MKKYILLAILIPMNALSWGQAKKPTLMVMPSDAWCYERGYTQKYDDMGTEGIASDYSAALLKDKELKNVITAINMLMADREFPLKDLESTMKSIRTNEAEDNLTASKSTGASLAESPLDMIRRRAKADIILEVDWDVEVAGFNQKVRYNLRALDAYTDKQVAAVQGEGQPSMAASTSTLLSEAINANMDNFVHRLQGHFDDLFANGREVTVELRLFGDGSDIDFETEFDGYELSEIVDDWVAENTVEHRYSKTEATENYILFEQVRIPLYRENGRAMDTDSFVRELRRFLGKAPYNIPSKVVMKGLGRCMLVVGEK